MHVGSNISVMFISDLLSYSKLCLNCTSFYLRFFFSFYRVQDLFKLSLTSTELRLRVVKNSSLDNMRRPPAPIYPHHPDDKENVSMVECEQKRK